MVQTLFVIVFIINLLMVVKNFVKMVTEDENGLAYFTGMIVDGAYCGVIGYAAANPSGTYAFVMSIIAASFCGLGIFASILTASARSCFGALLSFAYNTTMMVLFIVAAATEF